MLRPFVIVMAVAGWWLPAVCWSADRAAVAKPPNFLFLFADDFTYQAVRAFGNDEVETPNLDRLVRGGLTFRRAYNMGSWSGAVCVASRTMLITGRYVWHAHQVYQSTDQERQAGRIWPAYLKRAGYDTYMTGKWHIQTDATKAFDFTGQVRPGMPPDTPESYNRPLSDEVDKWKPWDPRFRGYWTGGEHWSEVTGQEAVEFIGQASRRDNPFFMYIAFNAPHDPRQSPERYIAKYPLDKIRVPASFLPTYPYDDDIGCGPSLRDEKLAPFPRTEHAVRVHRQEYYALITHLDDQIGKILDALEQSGQRDNTYIFFTADHGLAVGHHGLFGKQNMYDHSVRVPFIVVGPGIEAGATRGSPIYLQDIVPTTLELAGVPCPEHVEFRSLVPAFKNAQAQSYDAIYGAYLALQRMVTADGYKLILYPKIARARLFHVDSDPDEVRDLIDDPRYNATARQLFARLVKLQAETGDTLALQPTFPDLAR